MKNIVIALLVIAVIMVTPVYGGEQQKPSSLVLSCGSGCAMRYTTEKVSGKLPNIEVKFKVEMFTDGEPNDSYSEAYIFYYNRSGGIERICHKGKTEDILKNLLPNARQSFRNYAKQLSKTSNR